MQEVPAGLVESAPPSLQAQVLQPLGSEGQPLRFFCPVPGCQRSFSAFWRWVFCHKQVEKIKGPPLPLSARPPPSLSPSPDTLLPRPNN